MAEAGHGNVNAKLYIEDLQRAMKTLPKSVPANDPANENRMRQQELALKIFAAHIGIDAVNGSRRGKSLNVTRDFAREGDAALALAGNKAMQDWLWNTPYDRLRKLILTGHGGEMEKDFRSYLLRQPEIPAGTPGRFLPTAKTRCEALQAQLRAARKAGKQELEVQLCRELIVTRTAAGAQRGGGGLGEKLTPERLEQARRTVEADEALNEAIREAVADPAARALATEGHGGAFLERITERKNALQSGKKPDGPETNVPRASPAPRGNLLEKT